ncbi:hypothetical protein M0805_001084 [Coniferiporia weirii]|nr:hypothetical protein M0805_001084 [Coniferiporia weirii]
MSVDLTDPGITSAYDDIIKRKSKDWLLLSYGKTRDKLSLLTSGGGDFDDMCQGLSRVPEDVYFGFCRERDGERNYFALLTFVPTSVSGVKRARALVHSRAVGSLFKAANVSMNVANLDGININILRERLHLSPSLIPRLASSDDRAVTRSSSTPSTLPNETRLETRSNGIPQGMRVRGVASESQGRDSDVLATVGNLIRRSRISSDTDEGRPPPTPPKDPMQKNSATVFVRSASMSPAYGHSRPHTAGYMSDESEIATGPGARRSHTEFAHQRGPPRVVSPAEKTKLRLEAQKQRMEEEQAAQQEEAERQARLKRQKEESLKQAQEEEDRRLAKLEEEKRRALLERARKEREERLEEDRRLRQMELRKQQEKERRLEQTRRLEEERQEIERRVAEAARKREEERRQTELRRRLRIREIQEKFKHVAHSEADPVLLTGAVTMQTSMSISWKRRFFELTRNRLTFYRDSLDRASPLDIMSLAGGRVAAIKEPHEGYDELEAILHSFAVEFTDGEGAWCMFSDSAEDKDILVSLLSQAAGL